ncbi:hypothetical protein D9757_014429 [Collybiopsis confluens]|uniref:F-box domain-containing protein n=1 Tax=Collybiopsis confluens TaxID=2823264 RepID=A0A8H5FQC4_9AGAR|nr:hypothetical protein D9757_014429 [Collybiopsis confluens]
MLSPGGDSVVPAEKLLFTGIKRHYGIPMPALGPTCRIWQDGLFILRHAFSLLNNWQTADLAWADRKRPTTTAMMAMAMTACRTTTTTTASSSPTTTTAHFFPPTLLTLPKEILENIAFHHICPQLLGAPISLTSLLLVSKSLYHNLTNSKHLYAQVFKYKFSFSAICRRSFEPSSGEWASQLQTYCKILRSVRRRRRRPAEEQYADQVCDDIGKEEPLVEEILFTLWLMCLEDDGCNRFQMQISGVYEWVEGYIQIEMYSVLSKGWPIPNAANSCAMFIFWYLSSKDRLLEEPDDLRESIIDKVLPFLTVPFRYPTAISNLPLFFRTNHYCSWSFSIYLHPRAHHWDLVHFERRTPLCTPLAADSAKLVYFSRRETMLFNVPTHVPRNRMEHRERIRSELAAMNGVRIDEVGDREVEVALQNELPLVTAEDYMELNEGLLGGVMVDSSVPAPAPTPTHSAAARLRLLPTLLLLLLRRLPRPDLARKEEEQHFRSLMILGTLYAMRYPPSVIHRRSLLPRILKLPNLSSLVLEKEEGVVSMKHMSCWADGVGPDSVLGANGTEAEGEGDENGEVDEEEDEQMGQADLDVVEDNNGMVVDSVVPEANDNRRGSGSLDESGAREAFDNDADNDADADTDTERSSTFLTGYPQKGAMHTPGVLDGLWTGRMMRTAPPCLASYPDIEQLVEPLHPGAGAADGGADDDADGGTGAVPAEVDADGAAVVPAAAPAADDDAANAADPNAMVEAAANAIVNATQTEAVAVPIYVRLKEYVVYNGGKVLPCAADTEEEEEDGLGLGSPSGSGGGVHTSFTANVVVEQERNGGSGGQEKYEYVAVNSKFRGESGGRGDVRGGDEVGMFHDEERCTGCRAREDALRAVRARDEAESQAQFGVDSFAPSEGSSSSTDSSSSAYANAETEVDLPAYVPSPSTIPPCNGIRDVLVTGTTDGRHAEAWRRWAWKGRVRKEPLEGPLDATGGSGGGKIFFYGTILGGKNFVGTWRLANQDPRMPAYEGAFTLGKKEEDE